MRRFVLLICVLGFAGATGNVRAHHSSFTFSVTEGTFCSLYKDVGFKRALEHLQKWHEKNDDGSHTINDVLVDIRCDTPEWRGVNIVQMIPASSSMFYEIRPVSDYFVQNGMGGTLSRLATCTHRGESAASLSIKMLDKWKSTGSPRNIQVVIGRLKKHFEAFPISQIVPC